MSVHVSRQNTQRSLAQKKLLTAHFSSLDPPHMSVGLICPFVTWEKRDDQPLSSGGKQESGDNQIISEAAVLIQNPRDLRVERIFRCVSIVGLWGGLLRLLKFVKFRNMSALGTPNSLLRMHPCIGITCFNVYFFTQMTHFFPRKTLFLTKL